jgi:hypothetical protein
MQDGSIKRSFCRTLAIDRHRGVEIGPYGKQTVVLPSQSVGDGGGAIHTTTIILTLRIENNNKFVRGKKRTMENIERFCLEEYSAQRRPCGEYELKVPYRSDEDLDKAMDELLDNIASKADDRNCFSESDARMDGTDRHWG